MSVFVNINPTNLADRIHAARAKVIYAAPGIDEVIASAIINTSKEIGAKNTTVLLDITDAVLRFGYGNIDGVTLLRENGIPIKEAKGLRIGTLVYDDKAVIFSPTPLLIEAGKKDGDQPNAIITSPEQVKALIDAIAPSIDQDDLFQKISTPEIGQVEVSQQQIQKIDTAIKANPPQKFDIARRVQVFSTAFEFVELELKGCEIQRHTVAIPADLLVGKADTETKKQLKAGFNIIEKGSSLTGSSIRDQLKLLKKKHTKIIPKYGHVLLKSNKSSFNEAVEKINEQISNFQKEVKENLSNEINKAKDRLLKMLIPAVTENPPDDLRSQVMGGKPNEEQVKAYLESELNAIFPTAEELIKAMSLSCIFKAVTYETISSEDFQENIKKAYPLINWNEMFEEYDAARESY